MNYFVIGADGAEYGPASLDTLKSWVMENRVLPTTMLKSVDTGLTAPASSISALFPSAPPQYAAPQGTPPPGNWSQPPAASYPRNAPGVTLNPRQDDGKFDVIWAIVRCAIAIVLFFAFKFAGLITAIYALVWAFRAREKGHSLANVAIGISVATLIIIGIGWALRAGSPM